LTAVDALVWLHSLLTLFCQLCPADYVIVHNKNFDNVVVDNTRVYV